MGLYYVEENHAYLRERESLRERGIEIECVCVREGWRESVCVREGWRDSICVRGG